ncbi:hypothetical protein KX00_2163 [Francisella sp. TX07-6608]|nr:hypothetical protein KX00_2163 [Francisella sp. TX07-6608]
MPIDFDALYLSYDASDSDSLSLVFLIHTSPDHSLTSLKHS